MDTRQGERYVMNKLIESGWTFPKQVESMGGSNWAFEKNGRLIKIIIKTGSTLKSFSFKEEKDWNYLIFTNLEDIWVIPAELQEVLSERSKTLNKLKNKLNLLELSKTSLLAGINDCGVHFSDLDTVSPFFH